MTTDAPDDDDIAKQLLDGEAYEQAKLSTRQMVSTSLDRKVLLAISTLALSTLLAPAVLARRDLVRDLEGGGLDLALGLLVMNGIGAAFLGGLLLVRQQYIVNERSLSERQARKLVHIEDLLALVVVLGGMFVATPLVLAAVGIVSPSTIETLYANDVRVYRPDEAFGVDIRAISGAGALLTLVLVALRQVVRSATRG